MADDARRLDVALTERGLSRSRSHAARLIGSGAVTVNGRSISRASAMVREDDVVVVTLPDHYVSRGAHKLIAALESFSIDPAGRIVFDAGVSTGGFSQVLIERGARRVLGVDVGHDQLAAPLRDEPVLEVREGVNVRDLTREVMEGLFGAEESVPSLVVADLSFISLVTVLPALETIADPGSDFVLLVKPQFEVGRTGVREGIVRDPGLRADAVSKVMWTAYDLGLGTAGLIPSPIAGGRGNLEYLLWLSRDRGGIPGPWEEKAR